MRMENIDVYGLRILLTSALFCQAELDSTLSALTAFKVKRACSDGVDTNVLNRPVRFHTKTLPSRKVSLESGNKAYETDTV